MTIYERIKKIMEGKNGMVVTSTFIKNELKNKYRANVRSVLPSDFCYNRRNDGIEFKKENRLFEYVGRNAYRYLGEKYPYTGKIYQRKLGSVKDISNGYWVNGQLFQ